MPGLDPGGSDSAGSRPGSSGGGVGEIAADRTHGSAWISLRALAVLRDGAAEAAGRYAAGEIDAAGAAARVRSLAARLREARPTMAVLANRVARVMHACRDAAPGELPAAVERAADAELRRARDADGVAARRAAEIVAGRRVLTLSRSGTVRDALLAADPGPRVWVAESAPQREGVGVAEELAAAGLAVTLLPDAAVPGVLLAGAVDLVLLGADAVLPDGGVVNKTGSLAAALAASRAGIPLYAVAAADKIDPEGGAHGEEGEAADLYRGAARLALHLPLFEAVPADLVRGVVCEDGVLDAAAIAARARELAVARRF